jgi:hypothetical protein
MMTHASRVSGRIATAVTTAPAANAAAETPIASCRPDTNVPRAISVPSSARPIAPPAWRAALSTPEAIPARLAGAASMTAAVAAGIVNAVPKPAAWLPTPAGRGPFSPSATCRAAAH